ncbi:hypothetical protein QCA50_011239 [Cerrena zonata]|uniref:Uncharacterized protein n=1 Tax=Cerrena zonata TaxID=2478898 RepID=A0AAW0G6S2_9APHY
MRIGTQREGLDSYFRRARPQTPSSSEKSCILKDHGHSTRRLEFLQGIWEVRKFEWQDWERDNNIDQDENQTAYDGILRSPPPKPFHPCRSPSKTSETSSSTPQFPMSPVIASSDTLSSAPIYPRAGNLREIHDLRSVMLDRALGDVPLHSISKALFLWNMSHSGGKASPAPDSIPTHALDSTSSLDETSLYASASSLGSSDSDIKNQVLFQGLDPSSLARFQTLLAVLNRHDYARKVSDDFLSEMCLNGLDWQAECARAATDASTSFDSSFDQDRTLAEEIERPKSRTKFFVEDHDDDEEDDEDEDDYKEALFDDGGRAFYEYGYMHVDHPGDASMSIDQEGTNWEDMCF